MTMLGEMNPLSTEEEPSWLQPHDRSSGNISTNQPQWSPAAELRSLGQRYQGSSDNCLEQPRGPPLPAGRQQQRRSPSEPLRGAPLDRSGITGSNDHEHRHHHQQQHEQLPQLPPANITEKCRAFLLSLSPHARRSAFCASKQEVAAELSRLHGCRRCEFVPFVFSLFDQHGVRPTPWILPRAQLMSLLSPQRLVNLLQFEWTEEQVALLDTLLVEDRLLASFLSESLEFIQEVQQDWEECDRHRGYPGPFELQSTARRLQDREAECTRELEHQQHTAASAADGEEPTPPPPAAAPPTGALLSPHQDPRPLPGSSRAHPSPSSSSGGAAGAAMSALRSRWGLAEETIEALTLVGDLIASHSPPLQQQQHPHQHRGLHPRGRRLSDPPALGGAGGEHYQGRSIGRSSSFGSAPAPQQQQQQQRAGTPPHPAVTTGTPPHHQVPSLGTLGSASASLSAPPLRQQQQQPPPRDARHHQRPPRGPMDRWEALLRGQRQQAESDSSRRAVGRWAALLAASLNSELDQASRHSSSPGSSAAVSCCTSLSVSPTERSHLMGLSRGSSEEAEEEEHQQHHCYHHHRGHLRWQQQQQDSEGQEGMRESPDPPPSNLSPPTTTTTAAAVATGAAAAAAPPEALHRSDHGDDEDVGVIWPEQPREAGQAPVAAAAAAAERDSNRSSRDEGLISAARVRELHSEVAQIGFRRGRLACACEHGVVMGSRRLLAIVLTVSWRRLIAICQAAETSRAISSIAPRPLLAPSPTAQPPLHNHLQQPLSADAPGAALSPLLGDPYSSRGSPMSTLPLDLGSTPPAAPPAAALHASGRRAPSPIDFPDSTDVCAGSLVAGAAGGATGPLQGNPHHQLCLQTISQLQEQLREVCRQLRAVQLQEAEAVESGSLALLEAEEQRAAAQQATREAEALRHEIDRRRAVPAALDSMSRDDLRGLAEELEAAATSVRAAEAKAAAEAQCVCPVCYVSRKDMAFGCGHQTCRACGSRLDDCPICRQEITLRIRLYL